MKHQMFTKRQTAFDGGFSAFLGALRSNLNSGDFRPSTEVSKYALSTESFDPMLSQELETLHQGLSTSLESLAREHGMGDMGAGLAAASAIALVGRAPQEVLALPVVQQGVVSTESMRVVGANGGDFYSERSNVSMEAYDERNNRDALVFSVAYNLNAARQDEFGEAFFRTIVLTPEQVGFHVNVNLIQVQNEVRRNISGALTDFGRRNIIQAVINANILRDDQTKLVPVYRDESKERFVATSQVAPRDVSVDGVAVTTAPLKMGVELGLLEISQTAALLQAGVFDQTDAIDPSIKLQNIYLEISNADGSVKEVIKFNVENLAYSYFNNAVQGQAKDMSLTFNAKRLLLNKDVTLVDGSPSVLLKAAIADANVSVRLGATIFGKCNLEYGNTNVYGVDVTVNTVSQDGEALAKTDAKYAAVVAALKGATWIGYDLESYRTNSNRRSRGQLVNTNLYSQLYTVPLRAPVSVPRPVNSNDQSDASDLQSLITLTRIRCSNAAVTELLRIQGLLESYVSSSDAPTEDAEILGVARMLLTKPYYAYDEIDIAAQVDSLKSSERRIDIQAVLVNKVRDVAVRMYRDSGFKAAADALAGGVSEKPVLTIGTDPVIASYLVRDGDMRLAGDAFSVKVVESLDSRMVGKMVMTFTIPDAPEGTVHPLNFGYMAWRPEMTIVLPVTRNGQVSKELTVTPSFRHIGNLPVMAVFDVVGIEDVIAEKVSVNMHTV